MLALPLAPFFREVKSSYIPECQGTFYLTGETALAQYSNLEAGATAAIAMSVKEFRDNYERKQGKISFSALHTSNIIQIWK